MNVEVVNLHKNTLPKGCVPLEQMFDKHEVYKGKFIKEQSDKVLEFNIGTRIKPRMIKIG
jgi:hypothetical protein